MIDVSVLKGLDARLARDIDMMGRTLVGEAGGEPLAGQIGVAFVIVNRVKAGRYGASAFDVCRRPWQFSCWDARDPNRARIEKLQPGTYVFDVCRLVAYAVLRGDLQDPTRGATHYHTRAVRPNWSNGKEPCAVIHNHLFFNDID